MQSISPVSLSRLAGLYVVCFCKGLSAHCCVVSHSETKPTSYFPTEHVWLCKDFPFSFHFTVATNYLKIRMANLTPATGF